MEQHYVVPGIYQDMSDQSQGYFAFRFVCHRCFWQIDTRPVRSSVSTVSTVADIGIGLIGGFWGRAAEAGERIYGTQWHQEKVNALQRAWREIQHYFHFCPKCQQTVCTRCWNPQLNLCLQDAPDLKADGASFQHGLNIDAQRQQIQQHYEPPQFNVQAVPSAVTPDMIAPAHPQLPPVPQPGTPAPLAQPAINTPGLSATVNCPTCSTSGKAGKFCQNCGTRLPEPRMVCPACSSPVEPAARFCQECGCNLRSSR